jgi:hypothetical protein
VKKAPSESRETNVNTEKFIGEMPTISRVVCHSGIANVHSSNVRDETTKQFMDETTKQFMDETTKKKSWMIQSQKFKDETTQTLHG